MSELKSSDAHACPECGERNLHRTTMAGGGQAAYSILPGLGGLFVQAGWEVVVCGDCGLIRLYADSAALDKLKTTNRWCRVSVEKMERSLS